MTDRFSHYSGLAEDVAFIAQCHYSHYTFPAFAVTHLEVWCVNELCIFVVAHKLHYGLRLLKFNLTLVLSLYTPPFPNFYFVVYWNFIFEVFSVSKILVYIM